MEIGLRDGKSRIFRPGTTSNAADALPEGASFDANVHATGARSAASPLVTLFVKG